MTDEVTNGASSPVAATPAPLKSNDTSEMKAIEALAKEVAPAPDPKPQKAEEKEEPESPKEEGSDDDAPAADSPDKGKRKDRLPRWVKERLERERLVTEHRTREAVMRELEQRNQPMPEPTKAEDKDKTLADFDFDNDAYTAYLVERAVEKKEQERVRADEQRKQAEAAEKLKARIDAFEERVGDGAWEEILESPFGRDPKFKPIVDLIQGDEHDLDIAYELATNTEVAERLLSLSPLARVRELAKLAERFSGDPQKPDPVLPPKKTTNAPPPPKTVAGAGKAVVDLDDPNITPAQRIAEWKRREKR